MLRCLRLVLAALVAGLAAIPAAAAPISFDDPTLQAPATLQVQVAGLAAGATLPPRYTRDGHNLSPPISWSAVPGAKGYVVVMQDPDVHEAAAAVHWLVYDIPAEVLQLPGSLRNVDALDKPIGVAQGRNFHGSFGYTGPYPPPGDPAHHYHFQVLALSRPLRLKPGAPFSRVIAAMQRRVIARGDLELVYAAPVQQTSASPG